MVDALRGAVTGATGGLGVAVRAMFDLRMSAIAALGTPLADGKSVAGPAFRYLGGNSQQAWEAPMSILETPRIYFKGRIAWDPVTTNNYPAGQAPLYDEDDCDSCSARRLSEARTSPGSARRRWAEVVTAGNWNPHGTLPLAVLRHAFRRGHRKRPRRRRSLRQRPVRFTGMLVDLEPYGASSSQLFFDDISFGIDGGCRIYGRRVTRSPTATSTSAQPEQQHGRRHRRGGWQASFPKDQGLQVDSHGSPALQALAGHMADADVLG